MVTMLTAIQGAATADHTVPDRDVAFGQHDREESSHASPWR
jgi:hypothetical protein